MDEVVGNGTANVFSLHKNACLQCTHSRKVKVFGLANNPFIEYLLKVGVSIWFHTPSAERANQNRVQLAYPSLFHISKTSDSGLRGKGYDSMS